MIAVLAELDLAPAHVDIGKLASAFMTNPEGQTLENYVKAACADLLSAESAVSHPPRDVVIYGFGRIGRLVMRLLVEKAGWPKPRSPGRGPAATKDPVKDLHKRASLMRRDSIHGPFRGTIRVDAEHQAIICNGNAIRFIYATDPGAIDYTVYGIQDALVVDSTGAWRDIDGLGRHLTSKGVSKILLTTSGKGDMKNIVSGELAHYRSR